MSLLRWLGWNRDADPDVRARNQLVAETVLSQQELVRAIDDAERYLRLHQRTIDESLGRGQNREVSRSAQSPEADDDYAVGPVVNYWTTGDDGAQWSSTSVTMMTTTSSGLHWENAAARETEAALRARIRREVTDELTRVNEVPASGRPVRLREEDQ